MSQGFLYYCCHSPLYLVSVSLKIVRKEKKLKKLKKKNLVTQNIIFLRALFLSLEPDLIHGPRLKRLYAKPFTP